MKNVMIKRKFGMISSILVIILIAVLALNISLNATSDLNNTVIDTESFFKFTKIVKTKYEITSLVDFFLVDPQTTAVMASDKIFSKITYEENIFKTGEKDKAEEEIFTDQGKIVGE